MHTAKIGGPLASLPGPSGEPVSCNLFGDVAFEYAGDPNAIRPHLSNAILQATGNVIAAKLRANQVAIPTLSASLPHFVPEIVAACGAQGFGVRITQLQLQIVVPQAAPPPQPMVMPPTPMQSAAASLGQAAADHLDPRNYEYEAKINVGGFKIKASTDGGLDTQGLKNQVKDKAKSTVIWWAAGCLIVGLVFLGLAGLGGYIYWEAQKGISASSGTGPAKAAKWDGKSEFSCSGNDNVKLEGITASLSSGTAVKASGNCKLELVNCNITAPNGIDASANASVEVKGGSVTSTGLAAKAGAAARITFSGTKVTGKTQAAGAAKITGI